MMNSPAKAGNNRRSVLSRLIALAWQHRLRCLTILGLQILLLGLGLLSLALAGAGLDVVMRAAGKESGGRLPSVLGIALPETNRPFALLTGIAAAILVAALLRAALNVVYSTSLAWFVQHEIVAGLRARVFERLQHLSFRFFDDRPSGAVINRVTSDVQQLRMFVDGVVMQGAIMILSLGVYAFSMVKLSLPLTLACLATTPVLVLATMQFSRAVRPAYSRNRALVDAMLQSLGECVRGMSVVKGFSLEGEMRQRFARQNDAVFTQQRWIFARVSLFSPFVNLLTQINLAVLLGYGGWLVLRGELALGSGLVVFAGLLQQFSGQVSSLATIANSMQQSLAGAARVFEILDAPMEIQSPAQPQCRGRAKGAISFDRVSFSYDGRQEPSLCDVSFSVEPGQRVAILGVTGAGKSSLLSLIPRFYDVTAGSVRVDGCDVRAWDLADLRRNLGLVFQETFLFSMTIAENIAFGHPSADRKQIERAVRLACAEEFIAALPRGLDTMLEEGGTNLSGGQRQRLAIARALLLEPPILLLDDPSAALDPQTEAEISEAMRSAMTGRTTLVVAHRASILRSCDRVLVLDRGRVVQWGAPEELEKCPGPYRNAVAAQDLFSASSNATPSP